MILTGPNGCGKSTFMKSTAFSIIIAQALGIAPCQNATISIFKEIVTSIGVKEDLGKGVSTFMAQQNRITQMHNTVSNLKENEFVLLLGDEVYNGTTEILGAKLVYDFCRYIGNIKNVVSIWATHFDRPAKLENDMPGIFTNYHVELLEPEIGKFIRTFKLVKGANEWWFNDPEKAERFVMWLENYKLDKASYA